MVVATMKTMGAATKTYDRPVRLSHTVAVNKASPARSWLVAPKTGQIARQAGTGIPDASVRVIDSRIAGRASVANVASQRTLALLLSSSKNSWNTYRPSRVQVSSVVRRNVER